ncbi:MAG: rRNA methyltransferase, partial [Bacteroidota bacterium]
IPWTQTGYYLPHRPIFTLDPWWHSGAYYVQEASSMLLEQAVHQLIPSEKPLLAVDLCGAPGGKSTHLAGLIPKGSLLISNEVIKSRANILTENLQKWGSPGSVVTQNDPKDFQALQGKVDLLMVDAPCSGEGLFRKDPKSIAEWSPSHLQLCSSRQRRILMDAWTALRPGGTLIYSTCTFNPEENEENIHWLLQQNEGESLAIDLDPSWGYESITLGKIQGYYAWPHRVKGEGFFLAAVRKLGGEAVRRAKSSPGKQFQKLGKGKRKGYDPLLRASEEMDLWQLGAEINAFPRGFDEVIQTLLQKFKVIQRGLTLGEIKGKDFRPSASLALSQCLVPDAYPIHELDLEQSLRFLARESLGQIGARGWRLVAYRGIKLGLIKALGQRSNNYHPLPWKIRMNLNSHLGSDHTLAKYF